MMVKVVKGEMGAAVVVIVAAMKVKMVAMEESESDDGESGKGESLSGGGGDDDRRMLRTTVWTPAAARLRTAVSTAVARPSKPRDMEATEAMKPLWLLRVLWVEAT